MEKKNYYLFYVFFLALYAYEFSKTLQLTSGYDEYNTVMQYGNVFITGVGFLLFAVSRKVFKQIRYRKLILMLFNVLYTADMLYMMFVPGKDYVTFVCTLSLGYLGGMVYYYIVAALGRTRYVGRVAMAGQALSVLLQMLLPKSLDDTWIVVVILIVGFVLVTYLMLFPLEDWMFEEMLPYAMETSAWSKEIRNRLTGLLFIVIFADIFGCLVEVSWTTMWESGNVDMYTYPRLFMIAGHILAGVLADYKEHKYMDTALLIMLGIGFSGIYMEDHQTARLCIFYMLAGYIILYMNIKFWHLAPYTKNPEVWAGFGRVLYVLEGIVNEVLIRTVAGKSFFLTIVMAGAFAVVVYHIVKEAGYKNLNDWNHVGRNDRNPAAKTCQQDFKGYKVDDSDNNTGDSLSDGMDGNADSKSGDRLLSYIKKYELTPRESDVLSCILESDESMKVIATKLNISERMLYRYMKQLYEKTGTESRAGLVKSYYKNDSEE